MAGLFDPSAFRDAGRRHPPNQSFACHQCRLPSLVTVSTWAQNVAWFIAETGTARLHHARLVLR
jgi:hypothetical protein